ncbi:MULTISPECIES: septum site-determining protein MinC [unclassified Thioalkalivibrio]|uniref:septum site-determining protein MinC n=1 Tax=unclassified Thioalkalivibrio TaxID=2621013 RepID=UPI00036D74F5|nr:MULTISPECIES: septum site-determining protein MinC [unclassified Thioalkalivibrio]
MSASPSSVQAMELKGRMLLVSVLRVHDAEPHNLGHMLAARRDEAPDLMRDMPIVLDLQPVADAGDAALRAVVQQVRAAGFRLIGLQDGEAAQALEAADAAGLPPRLAMGGRGGSGEVALGEGRARREAPSAEAAEESDSAASASAAPVAVHSATRVVDQPVRSGQQVYARGGDLLVTAPVSAGAELLADGHITVLGPLRGRALAGVRGLVSARIFCRRLEAELLSIGGHYRIAEDITEAERGDNRLVTLAGESLNITES